MGTWELVPTNFLQPLYSYSNQGGGGDYAHHILMSPPSFEIHRHSCNGTTTAFFNPLAWLNKTPTNYDWPLCYTRSQIWRIHFWNWWSHGVTQCESLTPINIQWELWHFSKFVTWPWGQSYIYFFTICSRRYILGMQNFFWIVIVSISCWRYFGIPMHTWNSYLEGRRYWKNFTSQTWIFQITILSRKFE